MSNVERVHSTEHTECQLYVYNVEIDISAFIIIQLEPVGLAQIDIIQQRTRQKTEEKKNSKYETRLFIADELNALK